MQRVIVHGRVQGVNFRSFVVEEARQRSLEGWVRNLENGSVEAVFSGPQVEVDAMIALCRVGPRFASVSEIELFTADGDTLGLRRPGEKFSRIG